MKIKLKTITGYNNTLHSVTRSTSAQKWQLDLRFVIIANNEIGEYEFKF